MMPAWPWDSSASWRSSATSPASASAAASCGWPSSPSSSTSSWRPWPSSSSRGRPHEFRTYWAALFWTTTQLLTVSSQLPNPEHTATKVLDVVLEAYAIVVVTSLAATFTDLLHHRTRRRMRQRFKAEAETEGR